MKRLFTYISVLCVTVLLHACSLFRYDITTEVMKEEKIMPGNYTLILYGAMHGEDLETIALLDYEGDDITFEPYARKYNYEIKTHVQDDEALAEAVKFIKWYPSYVRYQLSSITDREGKILGYEVRPIYLAISTYGYSDVLRVYYYLIDKKVKVYISLDPAVERAIQGDGNGGDGEVEIDTESTK
jgi:hypothetical protein